MACERLDVVTLGWHGSAEAAEHALRILAVGGSASFVAYALVSWSFTMAPIALVSALRETSIVFALAIGVLFLKERVDAAKVLATMTTILGTAMLRLPKSS